MTLLGYKSTKETILALDSEGTPRAEIAERLGCKLHYVRTILWEKGRKVGATWSTELVAKARRFHEGALGVIAEALSVSVDDLRAMLQDGGAASPAPVSAPVAELKPAPVPVPPKPSQAVAIVPAASRPAKTTSRPLDRRYGLRALDGAWLMPDGAHFTTDTALAWSGTAEHLKKARENMKNAKYCKMAEIPSQAGSAGQ